MMGIVKSAAYGSGAFPMFHRWRHRGTLTAPMFHRVLDDNDPRWQDVDPMYTVGTAFFSACLGFFRRHYNIVALRDVENAVVGGAPLPPRSMLITFDDGWADNLEVAAPILERHRCPAVVFLAASAVTSTDEMWWQERLFGAFRDAPSRPSLQPLLDQLGAQAGTSDQLAIAAQLAQVADSQRQTFLAPLPSRETGHRMMVRTADLPRFIACDVALGVHGHSHAPLSYLEDPRADLEQGRQTLAALGPGLGDWTTLAFPHGRYDARVLEAAWQTGFKLVFTSDPHINAAPACFANGRAQLGRISIDQPILVDRAGRLDEAKLAAWLWRRPIR